MAARKEKQQPQLGKPGYATMNVPRSEEPLPDDIVSKLQVFNRLFMLGHYYLQKYPEKILGFLDYLMFLMEYSTRLNVRGMVLLDHLMREDFATNPEWNWSQHRSESHFTIQRVMSEKQFQSNYNTEAKQNQQQPGGFKQQNGYSGNNFRPRQNFRASSGSGYPSQNFSQGQSQGRGGQGQKRRRTDQFSEEVCIGWNVDSCSRGTTCK